MSRSKQHTSHTSHSDASTHFFRLPFSQHGRPSRPFILDRSALSLCQCVTCCILRDALGENTTFESNLFGDFPGGPGGGIGGGYSRRGAQQTTHTPHKSQQRFHAIVRQPFSQHGRPSHPFILDRSALSLGQCVKCYVLRDALSENTTLK